MIEDVVDGEQLFAGMTTALRKLERDGGLAIPAIRAALEPFFEKYGFRKPRSIADPRAIKNILILRLDEIGDTVLTSPLLRELRKGCPQAFITLVVSRKVYNLVQTCPYVDEVLFCDVPGRRESNVVVSGLAPLLELCRRHLWRQQYDLCINPRYDYDRYGSTLLSYLSGAALRVGYSEQATAVKRKYNAGYDQLLTHSVPGGSVKHEAERNLAVLRHLGIAVNDEQLEVWPDNEDEQFARQALLPYPGRKIAISLGPEDGKRCWPVDRYVQIGRWLAQKYGARMLLLGSPEERAGGQRLASLLPGAVIDFCGRTTLRQTAALLANCDAYLGRDTGVMHLAAAAGRPVVEISCHPRQGDPDHFLSPLRFGPWNIPHLILQPERPLPPCTEMCSQTKAHCIQQVTVEQVKNALAEMLNDPVPRPLLVQTMLLSRMCSDVIRVYEPDQMISTIPGVRTVSAVGTAELNIARPGEDKVFIWQRQRLKYPEDLAKQKELLRRGYLIVAEIDDDPLFWPDHAENQFVTFRSAHCVQTSTEYLANILRELNPNVGVFPNQIASLPPLRRFSHDQPVTIFFGAFNREKDWEPVMPALNRVLAQHQDRVKVVVVYDKLFFDRLQCTNKQFVPLCPYEQFLHILSTVDIALLPLLNNRFNRCKSDLKFIQCAARGAVVLASPTVYADSVTDGATGFLYENESQFAEKLSRLIADTALRQKMAVSAYDYVKKNRMLWQHYEKRVEWYRTMLGRLPELTRQLLERMPEMQNR
ncbi:MAG: Methyltransferase type 12 [Firmicutes bacterium]|nr:Methyltransferase type 12 [Bacillota bacterium]